VEGVSFFSSTTLARGMLGSASLESGGRLVKASVGVLLRTFSILLYSRFKRWGVIGCGLWVCECKTEVRLTSLRGGWGLEIGGWCGGCNVEVGGL
jgi:hypothetical protein